jgi:endonuclease III-like uncharacterized protein
MNNRLNEEIEANIESIQDVFEEAVNDKWKELQELIILRHSNVKKFDKKVVEADSWLVELVKEEVNLGGNQSG